MIVSCFLRDRKQTIMRISARKKLFSFIIDLVSWLRLLPNVNFLNLELTEFKYWFMNNSIIEDLQFFLQRLNRFVVECSYIINKEIMESLLLFILNRNNFFKSQYVQFVCKNISS